MIKNKNINMKKLIIRFITLVILTISIAFAYCGIKGYIMYKNAIDKYPISDMVEDIQNKNNFVRYDELPQIYVDAVVSTEDRRFQSHNGIDYISICRALLNDIKTFSFAEGGSTITQQLAKNIYFTEDKKIERKFAEVYISYAIEKKCTKNEILELYVNTIYFGSGYYGIYDAAQGYYGKMPNELTDYEAVMLAGLPNAPSIYSPNVNADLAEKRMKTVLKRMVDCNILSQQDADNIIGNER